MAKKKASPMKPAKVAKPSKPAKQANPTEPAELDLSDGDELSVSAAAKLIGIMPNPFYYHVARGNISPHRVYEYGTRKIMTFLRKDVEKLRALIRPEDRPVRGRPRNTDKKRKPSGGV